jgi:PAS domain S-box-containing protein
MMPQPSIAQLQQENDCLRDELVQLRQDYAQLQKSEALYRSLFEISNEGIYRWELDQPVSIHLPLEKQVEQIYQNYYCAQANDAHARMMGLTKGEDSVGLRLSDVHVGESQKNQDFMRGFISNGYNIRNAESEEIDASGRKRYFLNSVMSFIENDRVTGGWGTQIDITELRETQQAFLQAEQERSEELERLNVELRHALDRISESEQHYRSLFEISNEGIYRWQLNSPILLNLSVEEQVQQFHQHYSVVQANDVFAEMYGLAQGDDVVGMTLASHVAESEKNQVFITALVESGYRIRNAESEEIDMTGRKRYFLNSGFGFIENDRVTGGWGTQIDITELRQAQQLLLQAEQERTRSAAERAQELERLNAELQQTLEHEVELRYRLSESDRRFRELFENTNDGIYFSEYDGSISIHLPIEEQINLAYERVRLVDVNPAFAVMFGCSSPAEMIGRSLQDLHSADSGNFELQRAIIENGYQIRNFESEDFDEDGRKRYWLSTVFISVENNQAVRGWGIVSNITELRKAQEGLLRAEQDRVAELAKTNQALKNSIDRLAADPDLNGFLGHVVFEIIQQLNLYTAWVELYDPTSQTLQMHLLIEQGTLYLQPDLPGRGYLTEGYSPQDDVTWNLLLQTRQPVIITPDNLSQFFVGDELEMQRQWGQQLGIQCGINLLLMLGDEPLGLLVLFSTERTTFSREELELSEALAQQATLAIALTRLAEEAKHASLLQERNRIAQDIHDTLAQTFGGILIQLQATQYFVKRNPNRAVEQFNIAIDLARQGLTEARRSVWTLYDQRAEYEALETALPQLADQLTHGGTTEAIVTLSGTPYRLDPDIGQNLLRLAQEAINNALRHARASAIDIILRYESNYLSLRIRDNGCGFDLTQPIHGFGIGTMRQRADYLGTTLTIASQLGIGTEIAIAVSNSCRDTSPSNLADYLPPGSSSKP